MQQNNTPAPHTQRFFSTRQSDSLRRGAATARRSMGGRYHQKYKNCKRFKQKRIGSLIVYRIAHSISKWSNQNTNSSVFFIRIKQAKRKQFRPIINKIVTYVNEERETVQQSSYLRLAQLSLANDSDKIKMRQRSVLEQHIVMSNDLAQHQTAQWCMELISLVSNGCARYQVT